MKIEHRLFVIKMMTAFANEISKTKPSILQDYVIFNDKLQKGEYDLELYQSKSIKEVENEKRDNQFYSELCEHILDIRVTIRDYLVKTGQLKDE